MNIQMKEAMNKEVNKEAIHNIPMKDQVQQMINLVKNNKNTLNKVNKNNNLKINKNNKMK